MPYLVQKVIKGKKYFYLVSAAKISGKAKQFQFYLGAKKPGAKEIERYSKVLKQRVKSFLASKDPLLTIISEGDLSKLESAKKIYGKILKQSPSARKNYYEWFITTYTYDSNAIEGSTLSLRETAMVLFEGISPQGKSMKDVIAAENHKKAFDFLLSYKGDITKQLILKLHKILTAKILNPPESGKLRKVQVYVSGAEEIPPKPRDVEPQLSALLKWHKANKKKYHPVVVAAYFHSAFELIHPFIDFNGRTGRLLLNFILMKNKYPPIDIRNKEKLGYYSAIRASVKGNIKPLAELVIKYLKEIAERV